MTEKEQWIVDYLKNKSKCQLPFVDILDCDFVEAFIEKFDVKFQNMGLGAPKCPVLSKLLSSMYKKGLLDRHSHGTRAGLTQDGRFPKWTYLYELPKE